VDWGRWGIVFSSAVLKRFQAPPLWHESLIFESHVAPKSNTKIRTTINLRLYSFQQYVAVIPAPPLRTFHDPQFNNPGFSLFVGH